MGLDDFMKGLWCGNDLIQKVSSSPLVFSFTSLGKLTIQRNVSLFYFLFEDLLYGTLCNRLLICESFACVFEK